MREDAGDRSSARAGLAPGTLTEFLRELAAAPLPDDARRPPLPPGAVVGRFEIRRELGRGGFGVVYEARDRDLGRLVALKLVRPGRAAADGGRVSREAEVIARLSHPNLVTLFDVGTHDGEPFLVFELLRGRTLHARLEAGPITVAEAVHLAVEVARGLAAAHAEGVVHRDLKPSNVFVTDQGQVKLLDFGLAHVFGRRRVSGGTPDYMAPEQWEDEPEDERTDVFALGVMLHRMLAGAPPYDAGQGRWAADATAVPRLEVPAAPALGPLVARMLERAPRGRPRDGAAVLEALLAIEGALAAPARVEAAAAPLAVPSPARHGRPVAPAAAVLLVALAGLAWLLWRASAAPGAAAPRPSIAVLPFADLSPGQDQRHLSDGLADEIRSGLAQLGGLRVIGRTTSATFRDGRKKAEEIGRELGVESVLEGSLRTVGARARLLAQLVRAADGSILWTRTYERDAGSLFEVQGDVARGVVEVLRVRLEPGASAARPGWTADREALRQHLLGRELLRTGSTADADLAVRAQERAISLDPAFAQAWAGLAFALTVSENLAEAGISPVGRRRALEAAERAVTLAPNLSDGYVVRGTARLALQFDLPGARSDLARAVALEPSSAEARTALGNALVLGGERAAGLAELERAADLDPLSAFSWHVLGAGRLYAGDHAGAQVALRRALALGPEFVLARLLLLESLLVAGRPQEALAEARGEAPGPARLFGEAAALHQLGDRGAADAALEELAGRHGLVAAFQIAQVHAWRGEADQAFRWLDRASAQLDTGVLGAALDPMLQALRPDPRFSALLARVGLPQPGPAPARVPP